MSYQITLQDCINDGTTTFDIDAFERAIQQQVPQYFSQHHPEEGEEDGENRTPGASSAFVVGGGGGSGSGSNSDSNSNSSSCSNSENSILVKFEKVEEQEDGGDLMAKCWAGIGATMRAAIEVIAPLGIYEPT